MPSEPIANDYAEIAKKLKELETEKAKNQPPKSAVELAEALVGYPE